MSVEPPRPNLRDRNRERARKDIATAALGLFRSKGFDNVTVEEIATDAGVSSRTFFRYFESKEDALLADYGELAAYLTAALDTIEPDPPIAVRLRTVLHSIADYYVSRTDEVLIRSKIISEAGTPTARNLQHLAGWEQPIAQSIAHALGTEPTDLRPRAVAASAVAVFRVALSIWVRSGATEDLHRLVDASFELLTSGIGPWLGETRPAPARRPRA